MQGELLKRAKKLDIPVAAIQEQGKENTLSVFFNVKDQEAVNAEEHFKNTFEILHNIRIDISKQIKPEFEILPKRWRIERTFSWFGGYCRLARDFEYLSLSDENIIYISHSHLLLKGYENKF